MSDAKHPESCERLDVTGLWRDLRVTRCEAWPTTWLPARLIEGGAWFCERHLAEVEAERAAILGLAP